MIFKKRLFAVMIVICFFLPLANISAEVCLPKTGQKTCYGKTGVAVPCAKTGQDGEIRAGTNWPEPRFKGNEEGTITDKLTALMWTKNADLLNSPATWQEALQHIETMNKDLGAYGYKDWRLPNINELKSLVNAGETNNALWLMDNGFQNVNSFFYWSSTTYGRDTDLAWAAYMELGLIGAVNKYGKNYVIAVRDTEKSGSIELPKTGQKISYMKGDDGDLKRGVAWPSPRFTEHEGCVKDNLTGLTWTKNANLTNSTLSWQDALAYLKDLNLCGYNDWRLPNINEMRSLVNYGEEALPEWLNRQGFQNAQNSYYWSSSTVADNTLAALTVHMSHYGLRFGAKSAGGYFLPVRGGCNP